MRGLCYGAGAGTLKGSTASINAITKTFAGLGGLIFLLLLIAQFIAYFNYSNMADGRRGEDGRLPRSAPTSARCWLLIGFILRDR